MQHSSYRRIPAPGEPPAAKPARERGRRDHNRMFHRTLAQLRSALWLDDTARIRQLERRIDKIVARWEHDT